MAKTTNSSGDLLPFDPDSMGGSVEAIQPTTFDPNQMSLSPSALMINSDVIKPKWKANKYPVSKAEYEKMVEDAEKPDDHTSLALSATDAGHEMDHDGHDGVTPSLNPEEDLPEDMGLNLEAQGQALAPRVRKKFQAISSTGWNPPDCVIATGPKDVVVAANSEYRIYNKSGTQRKRQLLGSLFSTVLPNSTAIKVFDPRIIYDHYNKRFVMIAAATQSSPQKSWLCIAVSKKSSAMGSWTVWATDSSKNGSKKTDNWGDYPMLGFDSEAVYVTFNMFKGSSFQYSKLRIFNNDELYKAKPLKYYDFWNLKNPGDSKAFTIQPCEHYRAKGPGPAYMISNYFGSGNKLVKWTITNPLALWSGGSPSLSRKNISCRSYSMPPQAKQKGTSTRIRTNDNRLLSAVYQHAGGQRRIWTAHNTKVSWKGDSEARSAIQWYEVDVKTNKVVQQNAYGAKGKYYFFPAVQVDLKRNLYVIFGRSSSKMFAQLRMTGRRVSNKKHDLDNSKLIKAGESRHTSGRYGDYFGVGRDGSNPNRVYGVGEYAESSGQWGTYVAMAEY